jgi:serine/threonine-protein kinase
MSDLIGKTLKDFFVLRRIGRGAMADVYLAQQLSLGRQIALKVLNAELARDPNYVRRFDHEARAAAALVHGNIVQIYEVGQQDGIHYIAQEYVPGRNLGEVIRSSGSLTPQLTLDILRQVTAALAKAASEGIVHRDIKPENIMLARSGEVKVADFGLARVQNNHSAVDVASLTQVGVTMGTPLYMSPEQIEGRPLDSRSDIYSLGVTAYHMLSGQPPFTGESPLAVAVQHLNQPSTPLVTRRANVPPTLATIIERMMAKKPEERFTDPAALLLELHAVANEGAQQGWATRPDHAALTQILWAADQRSAATMRLDELMKTTLALPKKRSARRWWIAAVVACTLAGGALALLTGPRSLLAGGQAGPAERDSVWKQLYQAKYANTERAWQAVITNFPNDSQYAHNLARQGLVYFYFSKGDYAKALHPLEELAAQQDFKAFGLAGQVVAFANLEDDERAFRANERLTPDMRATLEQQTPTMAEYLIKAREQLAERAF